MTQQTSPSNNRNTKTGVLYSHKTRGTHTRVSRVRVTTVGKTPFPEKQLRSCPKCKESSNSMKILTARVGRIEELVNALAETTRGLASMSKREDRFNQNNLKFTKLDLTRCSLQDLQKLVMTTTNFMATSTLKKSAPPESVADAGSDAGTTTNTEETITEEPTPMEDIKATSSQDLSSHNNKQVENSSVKELKSNKRQDSGFAEAELEPKKINKVTQLSDRASSLN